MSVARVVAVRVAVVVVPGVTDRGIGLPPESLESIFEPFSRAPNAAAEGVPGLGLGLHICQNIVQRHGGWIRAESDGESRGSTFSFWLPRLAADPRAGGKQSNGC